MRAERMISPWFCRILSTNVRGTANLVSLTALMFWFSSASLMPPGVGTPAASGAGGVAGVLVPATAGVLSGARVGMLPNSESEQ